MKIKKALFIGHDNEIKNLSGLENKELSLKEMYPIIGCSTIEHVGLGKGVDMWIDEEGLLKSEVIVNTIATRAYRNAYPHIDPQELVIVGNVIITDNTKESDYFNNLFKNYLEKAL